MNWTGVAQGCKELLRDAGHQFFQPKGMVAVGLFSYGMFLHDSKERGLIMANAVLCPYPTAGYLIGRELAQRQNHKS